ncbi:DUF2790 domain-containing protein [Pseudomonas sp. 21TX0197]|uniref:DUF2790 domain-containing protein n=1 Tax=unclassified Pseudomonas TaxID=196821 RepID=UPI0009087CBF|nr:MULTISPECIES: DUF2790 domain-containing protein [unclassified Pseudomonas]MDB6442780.1 DUF2790 domain-containing protein [Pseudomonas sp. 21TX0197]SFW45440.1 Protein of unknown function [Pseudomonas sp. NFACC09-4]
MNTKATYAACLFAALNICTLSARAESNVPAQTYAYGSHLDIQKVLSLTEDANPTCGVVNARMTYLDSAGHKQALDYRKISENCNNEN